MSVARGDGFLFDFPQAAVLKTVGQLSPALLQQMDDALKASLALP